MTELLPNDRLLRALRCRPVDRTPVWFMRQAGRSLPEYRARRGNVDILETCRRPDEVVELTLQPLRRMPLDAAILFSDIMVPLHAIGAPIRIEAGRGPVIEPPLRDASGIGRLRPLEPETDEPYVAEAVRLLVKELEVPLIGFAGAPFTLASYLIEGGPSRTFARTKALLFSEPAVFDRLLAMLADIVVAHLRAQVDAGVHAVQLFDSWVGVLDRDDYGGMVVPHTTRVFEAIAGMGVPAIHFGVGTSHLLDLMRDAGGDAIGVDHRLLLDDAWAAIGHDRAIQGNLDPAVLLGHWDAVERKAEDVLARAELRDGHVFNLGHGVLPNTPVEHLQRLVDLVHAETERTAP
ncbi:MAG TPA: uroporphyrinogen decarboxylase [Actinomycetota bacterium]|nr:uroporphyrinogen decarboxylase [Actinomycetota bacterium]